MAYTPCDIDTKAVLTRVIETSVYGVKAYHVECDCGFTTRRVCSEAAALAQAKRHGKEAHS